MKKSWPVKALGDVCHAINGLWKGERPPFVHVGVIRNTNFTKEGTLDFSDVAYLHVEDKKFTARRLQFGDIVLERSGGGPKQPVGRVAIFERTEGLFSFSNFTSALRVRNSSELDSQFLHWYLHWIYISGATEGMQSHSTGIRNLDFGAYKRLPVPIPSTEDQRRIVAILEEAFAGIATARANAERNLRNARGLFESYLNDSFAPRWERKTRKLGSICAISSSLVDPRLEEYRELIHIGAGNIVSRTGEFIELRTARDEGLVSGKYLFDPSMVLYSKIRPYLMKVGRPRFSGLCSADIYPIAPTSDSLTRDYLYYLFLSQQFTDYAIAGSARAGMPKVNRDHLFNYDVQLPDVPEQVEVVSVLDRLSEETQVLAAIFQRKLAALDELKRSLLHRAFSGEL